VIAIIAVLIGLLCPPSRRRARRPAAPSASTTSSRSAWRCTTTSRRRTRSRLGASLNPYDTANNTSYWSNWSAHAQLLQYLEGSPIYAACNFSLAPEWANNYGYRANSTATNTKINPFVCPRTRTRASRRRRAPASGPTTATWGAWARRRSATPRRRRTPRTRSRVRGLFAYQRSYDHRERHRRDVQHGRLLRGDRGRSGRQLLEEAGQGDRRLRQPQGRLLPRRQHRGARPRPGRHPGVQCQIPVRRGGQQGGGYRWSCGAMGYTMFNTVIPPNGGGTIKWGACRNNCCPQSRHADYVNASSFHPGGVNVCFGDGSVRFVKNTIAMTSGGRSAPGPMVRSSRPTPSNSIPTPACPRSPDGFLQRAHGGRSTTPADGREDGHLPTSGRPSVT
jgi:prepilin-type processing-associated H-X9-DG protein